MRVFGEERVRFGEFELDPRAGELLRGVERIRLQEQPFQILLMLLERPGEVVTREEVRRRLWPNDTIVEFDHSIATAIKKLRHALDDEAGSPKYVETLPKRGFRFVYPLTQTAAAATAEEQQPVARRGVSSTWRGVGAALATAAVLGGLILAARWWLGQRATGSGERFDDASLTQVTTSIGADLTPSLSPDGSAIAYSSDKNGSFEIYVKALSPGGHEIQLTSDGAGNFEPAWSPDGTQIAYYSRQKEGIWLIPALGGAARRLTQFGSWPAWSPDGSRIAFQSDAGADFSLTSFPAMPPSTLWLVSARDGALTHLTQPGNPSGGHGAPSWSPDGKHILFSSTGTSLLEIWTIPSSGGTPQRLVTQRGYDPVYGPGGRYIYYSQYFAGSREPGGSALTFALMRLAVTADGASAGKPELVRDTGSLMYKGLRFSANGRFAAFSALSASNNLQSIRVSPATGEAVGGPVGLTRDTAARKTSPRFSPDSSRVAFTQVQTGEDISVWLVDADGSNPHPVGVMSTNGLLPGWLPGGGAIAIQSQQEGRKAIEAFDLNTGTTTLLRKFSPNDAPLRLSPDGKYVAYGERQGASVNIWVAPVGNAEGRARQLTFGKGLMSFPCWSPDGKTIAFEDNGQIAIVSAAGGSVTMLTADPPADFVADWSPDGDKIVFAGLRNGVWNIWWVSRRTRKEKQVTHYTSQNSYVRYPTWSPRGDQIAYEYAATTGNIWVMKMK